MMLTIIFTFPNNIIQNILNTSGYGLTFELTFGLVRPDIIILNFLTKI